MTSTRGQVLDALVDLYPDSDHSHLPAGDDLPRFAVVQALDQDIGPALDYWVELGDDVPETIDALGREWPRGWEVVLVVDLDQRQAFSVTDGVLHEQDSSFLYSPPTVPALGPRLRASALA